MNLFPEYCYENSVYYSGIPMATKSNVLSSFNCQLECKKTTGCILFSYNLQTLTCYLYQATTFPLPSSTYISGPNQCFSSKLLKNFISIQHIIMNLIQVFVVASLASTKMTLKLKLFDKNCS